MMSVLLVDDEPLVLKSIGMILRRRRRDWTCTVASSGEQALAELATTTVDVVVSDMRMPGMDGAELLERIQASHPRIARIILSGDAEPSAIERARGAAHEFMSKPLQADELIACIERVRASLP